MSIMFSRVDNQLRDLSVISVQRELQSIGGIAGILILATRYWNGIAICLI